ncbi:MAG: hypothetical protein ABIH23_28545 [bacterium]
MIDIPSVQLGGGQFVKGTKSLAGGAHVFFWIALIIGSAFLAWGVWMWWKRRGDVQREWGELDELSSRAGLTREEDAFIRRYLRRGKIKRPMRIMRSERIYASFFKKQTERAGQHAEFLAQSIQRKIFGSSSD